MFFELKGNFEWKEKSRFEYIKRREKNPCM